MEVLFLLIGLLVFVWLLPYIRCFCKRLWFYTKLMILCRRKKYRLHSTHQFALFGSIYGKHCDYYVETDDTVISIKLCAALSKKNFYQFIDSTHFAIKYLRFQFRYGPSLFIEYSPKIKPVWDFRYRYKEHFEGKIFIPVLIMNPISVCITYGKYHFPISNGTVLEECAFYTGSGFLSRLKAR